MKVWDEMSISLPRTAKDEPGLITKEEGPQRTRVGDLLPPYNASNISSQELSVDIGFRDAGQGHAAGLRGFAHVSFHSPSEAGHGQSRSQEPTTKAMINEKIAHPIHHP